MVTKEQKKEIINRSLDAESMNTFRKKYQNQKPGDSEVSSTGGELEAIVKNTGAISDSEIAFLKRDSDKITSPILIKVLPTAYNTNGEELTNVMDKPGVYEEIVGSLKNAGAQEAIMKTPAIKIRGNKEHNERAQAKAIYDVWDEANSREDVNFYRNNVQNLVLQEVVVVTGDAELKPLLSGKKDSSSMDYLTLFINSKGKPDNKQMRDYLIETRDHAKGAERNQVDLAVGFSYAVQ